MVVLNMAKLVDIVTGDKEHLMKRRQLPVVIFENLTMVMDLNSMGLIFDNPQVKGREFDEFMRKYKALTPQEVKNALRVNYNDISNVLNETVPCVGCRRNVERLFNQLVKSGHPTLDPLIITKDGIMTIREDKINHPQTLATLLHGHSTNLECLVETSARYKRSRRCALHSLEAGRVWAGGAGGWRTAWDTMRPVCRDRVAALPYNALQDTLHAYLKKHRFCNECKTKVLRAYQLLVEEKEPQKEKGYVAALYTGMKQCHQEKHLHVPSESSDVAALIARAEPELLGAHRERHAKTLEIAQEEVLICVGVCLWRRVQRWWWRTREEESSAQTLAGVGAAALHRALALAADTRSPAHLTLYTHLHHEQTHRERTRQQKKLRRRKRKERMAESKPDGTPPCTCDECLQNAVDEEEEEETVECSCIVDVPVVQRKPDHWSWSEHSQDCGYGSRGGGSGSVSPVSSRDGSSACSDGFCGHHNPHFTPSLQQMLMDSTSSDEEKTSYIPIEDVMEFKSRRNITEKRQELRETLRNKFAQMCVSSMPNKSNITTPITNSG